MKIRIEIDENQTEDEVVIRCRQVSRTVEKIRQSIVSAASAAPRMDFYKDDREFFFPIEDVLFFETDRETVYAHTADDSYRTKLRLYELEAALSREFVRISKSAVVNVFHILSIDKNLASASLIRFRESHKQVYVSRMYYKILRERLNDTHI